MYHYYQNFFFCANFFTDLRGLQLSTGFTIRYACRRLCFVTEKLWKAVDNSIVFKEMRVILMVCEVGLYEVTSNLFILLLILLMFTPADCIIFSVLKHAFAFLS